MVVLVVDQLDINADKAERHPPVAVDPDRPVPLELALQRMELVARVVQFGGPACGVQGGQDTAQLGRMGGLDAAK